MSKKPTATALATACQEVQDTVHSLGDYVHVLARAERDHIVIYIEGDDEPVARLTPLGGEQYGLSFRNHSARWERMPFAGPADQIARTMVDTLGPYLTPRPILTTGIPGQTSSL